MPIRLPSARRLKRPRAHRALVGVKPRIKSKKPRTSSNLGHPLNVGGNLRQISKNKKQKDSVYDQYRRLKK